ncbi:sensor histidine kinase [Geoalkalibacter sp.]|uniref:sensor histidine kinase n=1 Tax=Geoalkalibacter sp. TaxID=3041440 RepID=UPI00272DFC51|nr:ATP-binding protein [Geoalkalibacter sp.]
MSHARMQKRLAASICLLLLVVLGGLGWAALSFFKQEIQNIIAEHQYTIAAALAAEIDETLMMAQSGLVALARDMPRDPSRAQEFLAQRSFAHTIFENGLALLSPQGKMLGLHPYEAEMFTKDFSDREYLQETLRTARPVISKPFLSKRKHAPVIIMLTAPVFDEAGNIHAVLLGSLDLNRENFLGKLAHTRIGNSGYVFLFATDRTMIMHPDKSRILQRDVLPGVNPLFDQALEGFEGSGETVNSRGVPMLASFKRLNATDWILGATTPLKEAYASVERARQALLFAMTGTALTAMLVVWFFTERLTAPLRRLTRHVQGMAEKRGQERFFSSARDDEIGTLAKAFNALIVEIDREAQALQQSEALLAEAQRMACMGHWQVEMPSRRIHWSEEMYRIVGLPRDQAPSSREDFFALVHPEDLPWLRQTADVAFRGGGRFVVEHRLVRPDGEVRLVHSQAEMFRDDQGRPLRIFGTIQDVTERKRAESELQELLVAMAEKNRQLEQAYQELTTTQTYLRRQEKMASLGQLAAGVAHEINNPLGYISSNLGTLEKYLERLTQFLAVQERSLHDEEACEDLGARRRALKIDHILDDLPCLLKESKEGADRVKRIVQDLKSFSRLDAGEPVAADLAQCLESAINIVRNEIKYKAELICDFQPLPALVCRPQQLGQVFMNLLINAAQAIDKHGTIEVALRQEGEWASVVIRDDGCGIPAEHMGKLFDPFFTTKEVGKGTGLGLSIAYEIVQGHGGDIRVESEVGRGTTFTVRLPLVVA